MDEKKDSQKTRKKRSVNASDHSGWSSENSPWGGSNNGRGTGPEGKGDSGGRNYSSRHNLDLSKTPEAMTTMSYVAIPMTVYPVNGVLGFTINWTAIDSALVQGINYLSKALPYAGSLLGGVIAGALYPNDTIVSEKKEQEMLTNSRAFSIADKTQGDDEDAEEEDENKDVKKGRRAERKRCARIFSSSYATGRPDMAAHLAFNTPLSSAAAIHTLKMMGAVQAPATRVSLDSRMRAEQQVRIGADGHQPVSGSASAIATKMKQLYNVTKGKK